MPESSTSILIAEVARLRAALRCCRDNAVSLLGLSYCDWHQVQAYLPVYADEIQRCCTTALEGHHEENTHHA